MTAICVMCPEDRPRVAETGNLCEAHVDRIAAWLSDIPGMYARLDATPGGNRVGGRVSGSREAPLGVRTAVLDLIVPSGTDTVHDTYGDQAGEIPVATRLMAWTEPWALELDQAKPPGTVNALCAWLWHRLDWIAGRDEVADFAEEVRLTAATLRAVLGEVPARPEHKAGVPCPRCDLMALYRAPGDPYVECTNCGTLQTTDEYDQWCALVAAGIKEAT